MIEPYTCTHKEGVKRIAQWMSGTKRMAVVMAERVVTASIETPDVIAWSGRGESILVEVKISRADFHADKAKSFRRDEEYGVGTLRYFAAPAGVLRPEDMPDGWGLLAIHKYQVRELVAPAVKTANRVNEVAMLVSAMRRLELSATVFIQHDESAAAPLARSWEPAFDVMSPKQEELAKQFCAEIAGPRGKRGSSPDPVRLLEMAQALYRAERDECGPPAEQN